MNVGKNIQIIREIHDYSQAYLAEYLGVSQKTYSNLERSENNIAVEILIKLAELYNIGVSKFLEISTETIFNNNNQTGGANFYNNHHATFHNGEKEAYQQILAHQASLIDTQLQIIKELKKQ